MYNNRRRHARLEVSKKILPNSEFTPVDLSESGLKISSFAKHTVGKILTFKLKLDDEILTIKGVVRWCRESPSVFETEFHLGIEFQEHSISDQLTLRNYIEKQLTKQAVVAQAAKAQNKGVKTSVF